MSLSVAWSSGYVSELAYTFGFYRELSPQLLNFSATVYGNSATQSESTSRLQICELGCGQGFTANILAAANPQHDFVAIDFNPTQICGARTLAADASLANIRFSDLSFSELSSNPDLPDRFNIIVLHGIWSWINDTNRSAISAFIRSKLDVGGLVYISYNALPGWAGGMSLRRLFVDHASQTNGPITPRIEDALTFVDRLKGSGANFFRANPGQVDRFERIKAQDRSYLAHEYFNRDWAPFYHADVAAELAEAKLTFLGSAGLLEGVDAVNLTPEQSAILAEIGDPAKRETVKDFIVNQQFRRDIFVKGPLPLSPRLAREQWLNQRFALSTPRDDVTLTVRGTLGEANLAPDVYNPILDSLAAGPKTLRQMASEPAIDKLGWNRVTQALTILVGANHLQPCLPLKDEGKRRTSTRAFNRAVMERARDSADLGFLASPVTGSGIPVDRFSQLFLLSAEIGAKRADDWVEFALGVLLAQGQRIVKDGAPLSTPEENRAELLLRARTFETKALPVLRSLQVA
ncbi:class I SAM-dependent methyltransferase [Aureimonas ureilytica]|uniref:class I SAM-dependent methyltransferase n=1 Tax=Aureimonas ureilytica TaxID=401562 RepID=UPI00039DBB83|nr:class I SAM-dependent methyltransferase [Aureimonas ureilytica]